MRRSYIAILVACLLVISVVGVEAKTYKASDFGMVEGVNCSPLMTQALGLIKSKHANGEAVTIKFDKGSYTFAIENAAQRTCYVSNHDQDNPKIVGIDIDGMHNLTIDGGGSDFYFPGRMLPIVLQKSDNCVLKNFSIDNPNPQITQVEILTNDTLEGVITYKIAPWVNYRIQGGRLIAFGQNWEQTPIMGIAFERASKHLVYNTSDLNVVTSGIEEVEPRVIRANWKNDKLVAGTVVAMRSWHRPAPGVFMYHDKNTKLQNIKVHYAEGMGLLAQVCENIDLQGFSVCFRGADDPRYFTTQADATHFSGCKGLISSRGGLYENMMDDAINIHGTYLKVTQRLSDTKFIARYMHHQAWGFEWGQAGNAVQFVDAATMDLIDTTNRVVSIRPNDASTVEGAKEYVIEFEHKVIDQIGAGGVYGIENLEWTPSVVFANNTVRNNRARGALFSTPRRTVVEKNLFDHTSGTAILLCGDCNGWFETGACRDVLICNNRFINALTNMFQFTNAVISIYPEIPDMGGQRGYFHSGVVIEGNIFEAFDYPILYAKSVDGLIFRRNRVVTNRDYPAFHWNSRRFLFERVVNSVVSGNSVDGQPLEL